MTGPPPVRLVVVNGCSMTYGDELRDRLTTGWGAVLAQRLGADLLNLAACAGSNDRIVRLTVDRLGDEIRRRRLRPEEVLVLVMWSRLNRFEVFADEPDRLGGLPATVADSGWCRIHPAYLARRDRRSTQWYRHLQHDEGDRSRFFVHWVLIDSWLARIGARYGFLWAFDPTEAMFAGMQRYTEQIDFSRVLGNDRFPHGGPSLYSVGAASGDLGPNLHPLESSQQRYVDEHLLEFVTRLP